MGIELDEPRRSAVERVGGDEVAEIRPAVAGQRPFQHVGVHRPECGHGLVSEAVAERPDDLPLEVDARVRREDGVPVAVRDLTQPIAEDRRMFGPLESEVLVNYSSQAQLRRVSDPALSGQQPAAVLV